MVTYPIHRLKQVCNRTGETHRIYFPNSVLCLTPQAVQNYIITVFLYLYQNITSKLGTNINDQPLRKLILYSRSTVSTVLALKGKHRGAPREGLFYIRRIVGPQNICMSSTHITVLVSIACLHRIICLLLKIQHIAVTGIKRNKVCYRHNRMQNIITEIKSSK